LYGQIDERSTFIVRLYELMPLSHGPNGKALTPAFVITI
jgi:hypothetical protein